MDALFGFGSLVVAVLYFVIINKMFNIYYFGCGGIISLFTISLFLAALTLQLLGTFLPYIIGFLIIVVIASAFNQSDDSPQEEGVKNNEH